MKSSLHVAVVLFLLACLTAPTVQSQTSAAPAQGQTAAPAPQEPVFRPILLGQPAPPFELPTYDGGMLGPAGLKGKNVILIVPRVYAGEGRWCTICNYQYADAVLTDRTAGLRKKFNAEIVFLFPFDRNVVSEFLAVTPAQLEKIKGWKNPAEPEKLDEQGRQRLERMRALFAKDLTLGEGPVPTPFPILLDPQRQVSKTLGVFASEWGGAKGDQGIPSIFIFDPSGILRFKYISQTTADRPTFEYVMKILEIIGGL